MTRGTSCVLLGIGRELVKPCLLGLDNPSLSPGWLTAICGQGYHNDFCNSLGCKTHIQLFNPQRAENKTKNKSSKNWFFGDFILMGCIRVSEMHNQTQNTDAYTKGHIIQEGWDHQYSQTLFSNLLQIHNEN